MKYLLASILFFIMANCFAIDQHLIDADEQYFDAELKLPRIEEGIVDTKQKLESALWHLNWEENKTGEFRFENSIKNYRSQVEEKQNLLNILIAQQTETKKLLQKLEPLKKEYDKQIELEIKRDKFKTAILNVVGILGIPCIGLIAWLCFFRWIINKNKKYQQLFKDGKITQAEYDRLMSPIHEKSTLFRDDDRTNPATGLRMIGGCDSGGNPYGCSFSNSSTSETHKTKWD